eukprot:COSAG04_NODE_19947_length_404_cov_1.167213_1_plen_34_part_10
MLDLASTVVPVPVVRRRVESILVLPTATVVRSSP